MSHEPPEDMLGAPLLTVSRTDEMAPFLISVVSDSSLWMYVSSAGGLSCGRRRPEDCLFPYETDDRLHRASGLVGPFTLVRWRDAEGALQVWQPFDPVQSAGARNIHKTELGNRVTFEEVHASLGLTFRYTWANARAFGFMRRCELLRSDASAPDRVEVLDGLLGIMPSGVELTTQQRASALVNAYRRSHIDPAAPRLGVFQLSAMIVDRAEPAESLRANVVWSTGLPGATLLLSSRQVAAFRAGAAVSNESDVRGVVGAYLLAAPLELVVGQAQTWTQVADVEQSQADAVALRRLVSSEGGLDEVVDGVKASDAMLASLLAGHDAQQKTAVAVNDAHHLANVLFNAMRGGVPVDGYRTSKDDVVDFMEVRNPKVAARNRAFLDGLPDSVDCSELWEAGSRADDPQLTRLCLEYLPIAFSRRHGDPSRPWNHFDIEVRDRRGRWQRWYQGNWRDIFQNWEALAVSFPMLTFPIIAKFVNASTLDGFNPYRISREGIDWEVPDPEDPWSNIGYWGDHQIVYLNRLLELAEAVDPGRLAQWLTRPVFAYANVPYRLADYDAIVADPRNTIQLDDAVQQATERREQTMGTDGRLVVDRSDEVTLVNLSEKLLVPVLSKLCNLCPDGGVWMNTQRPEWNDANNALAGFGLSMVTTYQLRRHLERVEGLFGGLEDSQVMLSSRVADWLDEVASAFEATEGKRAWTPSERRAELDRLGLAFERYRKAVYADGPGEGVSRPVESIRALLQRAIERIERTIESNRRHDGLYHAYNVIRLTRDEAKVSHLYEMLEGVMAVLGSKKLTAPEAISVIDALFDSAVYREDQRSFMLYPDRRLPDFFEKNRPSPERVEAVPLLLALVDDSDESLMVRDVEGVYRFAASLRNADDVEAALKRLQKNARWARAVEEDRAAVLDLWEETFDHHAFTGRSGTMYGYEGLGCIYWHMVSKLLLSVQEVVWAAREGGADVATLQALLERYDRVRSGLGPGKTPKEYGAFPTDPYSHTPKHAGAQQPGMTGQVKEEILTRFGELGVRMRDGEVHFDPFMLRRSDFLTAPSRLELPSGDGVDLEAGQLGFTLGGVPIVYTLADDRRDGFSVRVTDGSGRTEHREASSLGRAASNHVFRRDGAVGRVDVRVPAGHVR